MHTTQREPVLAQEAVQRFEDMGRYLEFLLDEIQQAIADRRAAEVARSILDQLVRHATEIFAREEDLMLATGYTGLEAHRQQHSELTEQLIAFRERAAAGNAAIGFELKVFLKAWLARHVQEADRRFTAFMLTLGNPDSGPERSKKSWWQVW